MKLPKIELPPLELPNLDDYLNSTAIYTDYKPENYDEYDYYNKYKDDYKEDYTDDYKLEDFYDYPEISECEEEYVYETVTWNLNFQTISIIINLLHLTVLTRKQLRSNAIYIYMMAICFSDILNFAVGIYDATIQYVEAETPRRLVKEEVEYFCVKAIWFVLNIQGQILSTVFEITKRFSIWVAILMALVRTVSVVLPMNDRVQSLVKVKWTLLIIFFMLIIFIGFHCFPMITFQYRLYPDIMPLGCPNITIAERERYLLIVPMKTEDFLIKYIQPTEIVLKFIPPLLYPILTIGLLIQLHSYAKKRRKSVSSTEKKSSDSTTKLVLFMTISFMLSEGMGGAYALLRMYEMAWSKWSKNVDLRLYVRLASYQIDILHTLNALSHPIVCCLMSAQYRSTIKESFCYCCGNQKKSVATFSVVKKPSGNSSRTISMGTITN